MRPKRWGWIVFVTTSMTLAGCGIAPKSFQKVTDSSPIVRTRSVGLAEGLPEKKVVPALIDRLEDKDAVVRLAAYEELKQGTGKSFGFVPWAGDAERSTAVSRWRDWWKSQQGK